MCRLTNRTLRHADTPNDACEHARAISTKTKRSCRREACHINRQDSHPHQARDVHEATTVQALRAELAGTFHFCALPGKGTGVVTARDVAADERRADVHALGEIAPKFGKEK